MELSVCIGCRKKNINYASFFKCNTACYLRNPNVQHFTQTKIRYLLKPRQEIWVNSIIIGFVPNIYSSFNYPGEINVDLFGIIQ